MDPDKTYILDGGIKISRTLRDTARSIARKRGCTEEEAARLFFGGEVFLDWKRQFAEETGYVLLEGHGEDAEN